MITARITDGLGNQLFQYAAGRAASLRLDEELRLDLSWFQTDRTNRGGADRRYSLRHFQIAASESWRPARNRRVRRLQGGLRKAYEASWFRRQPENVLIEWAYEWTPAYFEIPNGATLVGYWQSEDYFTDAEAQIRKDFRPRGPLARLASEIRAAVKSSESVGVHVRRGDFLRNTNRRTVCGPSYYASAVEALELADPTCFVFSDDPTWCRTELRLPGRTVIVSGRLQDWEELILLSECDHKIISASTFSWWGAWLGEAPGRKVIAPTPWVADGTPNQVVPSRWKQIPV